MRLVDKFRLLNAEQLWNVLGGNSNQRAFARRLATLFHARVLDRPHAQFRPGQAARPFTYAVGPLGRRELDHLDGVVRTGRRNITNENERLKLHFIDHETAVAEVALAFQLATEQQGWKFELALDDEISAATGLPPAISITFLDGVPDPLSLRPDCHFGIDAGDGHRRRYFVEVDLGTEPQIRSNFRTSSILKKLLCYWELSRWDRSPVDGVIFVTTTTQRLHNMIDLVRRVDPKARGSHFFSFALLARCRIEHHASLFYEPTFRTAKINYDNPRRFFLDTCERCNQCVDPANELHRIVNSDPRIVLAPASTPLDQFLPDGPPAYEHVDCPGLRKG